MSTSVNSVRPYYYVAVNITFHEGDSTSIISVQWKVGCDCRYGLKRRSHSASPCVNRCSHVASPYTFHIIRFTYLQTLRFHRVSISNRALSRQMYSPLCVPKNTGHTERLSKLPPYLSAKLHIRPTLHICPIHNALSSIYLTVCSCEGRTLLIV